MNDWQLQVVEEKTALDIKIEKLESFTESDAFNALVREDRDNLYDQLMIMQHYSEILANRINRFEELK